VFPAESLGKLIKFSRMSFWYPELKAPSMTRNPYARLSQIYIRLIRGYSPSASEALGRILNTYGPRAAYYAGLGLALLARKAKHQGYLDQDELYAHHLSDMPEVLPLYHEAVDGLSSDMQVKNKLFSETA
jgi:hypothetical protein